VSPSSCGFEVADYEENTIAELQLRTKISFNSSGIAIAEVFPSSCGIAIGDLKKSCGCPPLVTRYDADEILHLLTRGPWQYGRASLLFLGEKILKRRGKSGEC
jgi:hypothetical protein